MELRWDFLASTSTELVADLDRARDALRKGQAAKAEKIAERVLRRSKASAPGSWRPVLTLSLKELRGCATIIRGLAAERQERHDDAHRMLTAAVTDLDELLATHHRLDPLTLADYGTALVVTGRPALAAGPLTEALKADVEVSPDLVMQLAEALRRRRSHEPAANLLLAAHRRYPRHAGIASALALALERAHELELSVGAHLTAGMLLAEAGRLEPSLKHLARAQQLAPPQAPEPALALAQVLLALQLPEAEEAIGAIVDRHSDLAGAYALEAELLASKGGPEKALEVIERALNRFPDDPWLLTTQIGLLTNLGKLDEARASLQRALELDATDADWLLLLADVLRREGRPVDDVAGILRRLTASAPESVEYRLALADVLATADQYNEALQELGSALVTLPQEPRLLGRQAELLARQGRHHEAIAAAREALVQGGDLPRVAAQLAESLLAIGDAAGAVEVATDVLRQKRTMWSARRTRGLAWLRLGQLEKATNDLQKVLTVEPDDSETRFALADALGRRAAALASDKLAPVEQFKSAQKLLEQAVALNPEHVGVRLALGETLSRFGEYKAALSHLQVAVRLQPDSVEALARRGQVRSALGDAKAVDDLRRAADLDRSVPWVQVALGDALRMVGRFEEAVEALQIAVDLDPSSAEAWALKGAAEFGADLYEEARTSLDKALELDGDNAWAQAQKAQLLFNIDELESALLMVERALAIKPDLWWAWYTKGWLLDYLGGSAQEAEEAFRHAAAAHLDYVSEGIGIGIGEALMRQDRVSEAAEEFERVVSEAASSETLSAAEYHSLGWSLLRLGRYPEALKALSQAASLDLKLIEADFDLSLALFLAGDRDLALDEYQAAVLRVRTLRHPGRRQALLRVAARDLEAVLPQEPAPAELEEIYRILASAPASVARIGEEDDVAEKEQDARKNEEAAPMKLLYIPAVYKCRAHDVDLTSAIRAKVEAEGMPISSFGWQRGRGERGREAFRVKVHCPGGDGHELLFRGTYGPE